MILFFPNDDIHLKIELGTFLTPKGHLSSYMDRSKSSRHLIPKIENLGHFSKLFQLLCQSYLDLFMPKLSRRIGVADV